MTWVRFEDRFPWHRKVRVLSDAAFRLHVSAICWCCEHLTDGHIPRADLGLVSDIKRPEKAVGELVDRGAWIETADGWQVHDFLTYNPSAEKVKADRQAAAERQRRAREAAMSQRESRRDSTRDSQRDSRPRHSAVTVPPTRPVPNPTEQRQEHVQTGSELALIAAPAPTVDSFDAWWSVYPRKVAKKAAEKAWVRARKDAPARTLLDGARRFAADPTRDPAFTPHPATWLNEGRWEDVGPARPPSAASTSNDRVTQGLALVEQFRQQEGA